jgi:hypothetical protein
MLESARRDGLDREGRRMPRGMRSIRRISLRSMRAFLKAIDSRVRRPMMAALDLRGRSMQRIDQQILSNTVIRTCLRVPRTRNGVVKGANFRIAEASAPTVL